MSNPTHASLAGPAEVHPPLGNSPYPNVVPAAAAESYRLEQVTTGYNFQNLDTSGSTPIMTFGDASLALLFKLYGGLAAVVTDMATTPIAYAATHLMCYVNTNSTAISYTLPAPASAVGRVWFFIDGLQTWGTNGFTLNRTAGGNINGAASNITYSTSGTCVLLYCDGSSFFAFPFTNLQPATQAGLDASVLQHQIFAR